MSTQSFTVVLTPNQVGKLGALLKAAGLDLLKGTLPKTKGVTLSYVAGAVGAAPGLPVTFTVEHKPFYVTMGEVQNAVQQMIDEQSGPTTA